MLKYLAAAAAISATISLILSIRHVYRILKAIAEKRDKDFDLYYIPIFLIQIYTTTAFWRLLVSNILGLPMKCYPSIITFTNAMLGVCYLQIAINWLEIAS